MPRTVGSRASFSEGHGYGYVGRQTTMPAGIGMRSWFTMVAYLTDRFGYKVHYAARNLLTPTD